MKQKDVKERDNVVKVTVSNFDDIIRGAKRDLREKGLGRELALGKWAIYWNKQDFSIVNKFMNTRNDRGCYLGIMNICRKGMKGYAVLPK